MVIRMASDSRQQLIELLRSFPALRDVDLEKPLELDSVDLLQLVTHLEQALGLDLEALDVDPDELRTLDGILKILDRHQVRESK